MDILKLRHNVVSLKIETEKMDKIILPSNTLLVREIKDYYTKGKSFQTNMTEVHGVGVIEAVGEGYSKDYIGYICYFKKLSDQIKFKDGRQFYLVTQHTNLAIILDEIET